MKSDNFEERWKHFKGDSTKNCLLCGYRWPIQDMNTVTDTPGCPQCGGDSNENILTESHSKDWHDEELLQSALIEIEVFAEAVEGINLGWLKRTVDEFLKILINADLDTASRLSGCPAGEYKGSPGWMTGPDAPGAVPDELVREFLDSIMRNPNDRASQVRRVMERWDGEDHKN
jgi:hypothetical protein